MNSNSQNHALTASSQVVGGSRSNQQNTDSVDQQDVNDTFFDEYGDEVVGSKRETRSMAWFHYIKFILNGELNARCKYCSRVLGDVTPPKLNGGNIQVQRTSFVLS
uniref:BED-type domain-containing protein n=1 Tax=Lactuca sativa TaxID=4236 RepID=A0A9R1WIG5_LACSA|nr:hypothetical protein LSAT_V11C100041280 [Lactuca sativa]